MDPYGSCGFKGALRGEDEGHYGAGEEPSHGAGGRGEHHHDERGGELHLGPHREHPAKVLRGGQNQRDCGAGALQVGPLRHFKARDRHTEL